MKKFISLLLAVVMLFLLVGCNSNPKPDDPKKAELSRGKIDGDVYSNEFLGFKFTKPQSWVYSTDEEIAAAVNMGTEMFLGENFKEALDKSGSMYDMMVIDTLTRSNINVGYENLTKTFSSNITVEQYIEALKQQLSSVSGMKVSFPNKYDTVKLGETEFTRVVCSTTSYGTSFTQVFYLNKVDNYMGFVIATIQKGYTVSDIEALFE